MTMNNVNGNDAGNAMNGNGWQRLIYGFDPNDAKPTQHRGHARSDGLYEKLS